jgi:putative 4-mercaptohistidine N1-methyltranferase
LGCAVGGASFELSKYGAEVIGIDFSYRFIQAAQSLQQYGRHEVQIAEEGDTVRLDQVRLDPSVQPERVRFHQGDALDLPRDLGQFDVVLLANLIDRLPTPRRFLQKLPDLVLTGGQLIITSPYTWLETFTPKEEWLGGYEEKGQNVQTLSTLRTLLEPHFEFRGASDLPFLIREHARKFQWSVAEASRWTRR